MDSMLSISLIAAIIFAFLAESVIAQDESAGPSDITKKLTTIEGKISNLNVKLESIQRGKSLDSEVIKITNEIETSVNNLTETLSQSVNDLNIKLDELEKKIREEAQRRSLAEIVDDLKSSRFSEAMQKLLHINDDSYHQVVHTVYDNQANNFELLLNFSDSIPDTENKLKIYGFLCQEIAAGDLQDMCKLCRFSQSVREILDRSTGDLAAQAEVLLQMLVIAIQKAGVEPISLTFQRDDTWTKAKTLSLNLTHDCPECTLEMYRSVVETVWNKITLDDLLSRAYNLDWKALKLAVQVAVAEKLERTGALYTNSAILLGYHMKLLTNSAERQWNYQDPDIQSRHEKAKNKLPESVKNLFFSSAICIKNIKYNEYLYAGVTPNDVPQNNLGHHVYTSIPKGTGEPPKFKWYVNRLPSYLIRFRDEKLKETLYAGPMKYDDQRRYAILLKRGTGNIRVTNGEWQLDVDGNNTRIVNVALKEYLLADVEKTQNGIERYVFTSIGGKGQAESQWKIEDCSDRKNKK